MFFKTLKHIKYTDVHIIYEKGTLDLEYYANINIIL